MLQHKRFTIVALALSAAWSSASFAEESPAAAQCLALALQDKFAEAEPYCAKAAEEPGKDGKLLNADVLARKGDFDGAIKRYSELLDGVDFAKITDTEYFALTNRARARFLVGDPSAEDDALAALKIEPKNVELLQSAAQFSPLKDRRLVYASSLVELEPKSVQAHFYLSMALIGAEKFKEALAAADTAAQLDSSSALPPFARGVAYRDMYEIAKAQREFAAAALKDPSDPNIKAQHADVLISLKIYHEAIEVATEALKLRPDYSYALQLRAVAYKGVGDVEAAIADIDAALRIKPDPDVVVMRENAEKLLEAQKAMQPDLIFAMERDRQTVLAVYKEHLTGKCGQYSVPDSDEPDKAGLDAYQECMAVWYRSSEDKVRKTIGREVLDAERRFHATAKWVSTASRLKCSEMPANSRCIPDWLYARAWAARDLHNPSAIVGEDEFVRLKEEVAAYNAPGKHRSRLINSDYGFREAMSWGLGRMSGY